MNACSDRKAGARRLIKCFAATRRGSAAVEFAMVALPFLALIFGIVEISMYYLVSTTLENATSDAARQIRTGQLQGAGLTAAQSQSNFSAAICSEMAWLGSCSSHLNVDVRTFASFSSITQTSPIKSGAVDPTQLQFQMGSAGNIVLVRAFYSWTLFTPQLDGMTANLSGGSTLITAATSFKNEPYSGSGS
jgi:Flp pilus assembly protein TadG